MPGRPRIKYNSLSNQWELRGKGGAIKATFQDDGDNQLLGNIEVGASGDKITKMFAFVATLAAAVAIGSGVVALGTLQSATGSGVGCADLAVGDMVFGQPKANLTTPNVNITGFNVPTTSTLNVFMQGAGVNGVGSLIATGFNIWAVRV